MENKSLTNNNNKTNDNNKTNETIKDVMRDLEYKVNPKSVQEGLNTLITAIITNDTSNIIGPIESGAREFEKRVGRRMTYSEIREMWG